MDHDRSAIAAPWPLNLPLSVIAPSPATTARRQKRSNKNSPSIGPFDLERSIESILQTVARRPRAAIQWPNSKWLDSTLCWPDRPYERAESARKRTLAEGRGLRQDQPPKRAAAMAGLASLPRARVIADALQPDSSLRLPPLANECCDQWASTRM